MEILSISNIKLILFAIFASTQLIASTLMPLELFDTFDKQNNNQQLFLRYAHLNTCLLFYCIIMQFLYAIAS